MIVPFGMLTKPAEILVTYERPIVAKTTHVKQGLKAHAGRSEDERPIVARTTPVKLSAVEKKYVPLGMPQGLTFGEQVRWVKAYNEKLKGR